MVNRLIFLGLCVILSEVTTQTLDDITPLSNEAAVKEPKPSTSCATESLPKLCQTKWEEIMPALETLKSTSKIKKERLFNVVKIIKYLLSDEMENKAEGKKNMEVDREKICENKTETTNMFPEPKMPDFDSIVAERLKSIKEIIDDRSYMLDKPAENKTEIVKETPIPKNKTADFSKILSKIATALAKLKDQNQELETETPNLVPIFRTKNNCNKNEFNPTLYENPKQLGNLVSGQTVMNPKPSKSMFNIPCQRASDILDETATFPLPRDIFCDNPTVNLKSMAKNTKFNLDNLPFENIVPGSISCVDSDDSLAILFKPKTISLMQVYGNLLKKITINVLVPYYVSKFAF